MKTTILTKKTGAGHFNVTLFQNGTNLGNFDTTDMQLIDDISEMNDDGFESELIMHETFEEVITTCIKKINIQRMDDEFPYRDSKDDYHFTKYDGTQIR